MSKTTPAAPIPAKAPGAERRQHERPFGRGWPAPGSRHRDIIRHTQTLTAPGAMPQVLNGGLGTSKASTNRYYLSTDGIKSAGDVQLAGSRAVSVLEPGVASDGNRVAAVPATLAPGAYHLIVCADDAKGNTEVDETNNCSVAANATLQVALPDLALTFVTGQPLSAKVGRSIPSRTRAR